MPDHTQNNRNNNNKQGKQKTKQKNKNGVSAVVASSNESAPRKQPLLTFSDDEELKVRDFSQSKASYQGAQTQSSVVRNSQHSQQQSSAVGSGKKQKNRRKGSNNQVVNFDASNIQLKRVFSSILEQPSQDEGPKTQQQKEEIDSIRSIGGEENFELLQEPTESQPGSFRLQIEPNCGEQVAGCYIKIEFNFKSVDSMEMEYKVLEDTAFGLTDENLAILPVIIDEEKGKGHFTSQIIDVIRDYLGQENNESRTVIQHQVAEEQLREQKRREDLKQKKRKQVQRRIQEHESNLQREFNDEQLWCQNLALIDNSQKLVMAAASINQERLEAGTANRNALNTTRLSGGYDEIVCYSKGTVLDHVNKSSRYATDFEEIEEIGRGGFGIVCKALHRLDGNIYAIKKMKMSDKSYSKIRREITYLSSLNNQYIVRYFQTWVEHETDPAIIEEFAEWNKESEEEDDDEGRDEVDTGSRGGDGDEKEFVMNIVKETAEIEPPLSASSILRLRSSSLGKTNSSISLARHPSDITQKKAIPFMALKADPVEADEGETSLPQGRNKRAMTEQLFNLTPDPKSSTSSIHKIELHHQKNLNHKFQPQPVAARKAAEEAKQEENDEDAYEYEYYDEEYYDEEAALSNQQDIDIHQNQLSPPESESDFKRSMASEYKHRGSAETREELALSQGKNVESPSEERRQGITILYIQMQYCDGETLQQFLQNNPGRTNEKLKWRIYRQILEAVSYLHQREIIHRDIKPENIFLDHNKDVRLGDFGLAKRITPYQNVKKEVQQNPNMPHVTNLEESHLTSNDPLLQDPKQRTSQNTQETPSPLVTGQSTALKQLTTGVGTLRFAAPEQLKGHQGKHLSKRAGAAYGFKADIYSLGVVLLDLFRNHDIYPQELNDIHESITLNEQVPPSLAKTMPEQAVPLIEQMVKKDPDQRPTLLEVLTNDSLPQDEILRKVMPHLRNHKSSVKLQLMRYLGNLEFPKALQLSYHGDLNQYYKNLATSSTTNKKQQTTMDRLKKYMQRESIRVKLETNIIRDLRHLFENNGAHDIINLSCISPILNDRTIFLSKPIRLQPWLQNLKIDQSKGADLDEALCSVMGKRSGDETSRLLTEDHLEQIGIDSKSSQPGGANESSLSPLRPQNSNTIAASKVKPLYDLMDAQGQGSCWQELNVKGLKDLIQPSDLFKLIDERGFVLGLQPLLIDAFSRMIAAQKSKLMQKMYHIGQTYSSSAFAKHPFLNRKIAPQSENHACFVLVSHNLPSTPSATNSRSRRSQIEAVCKMSEEELMLEVDALRVCDAAFRGSNLKYVIKVSSSELIDALFEECQVDLPDRIPLLKFIQETKWCTNQTHKHQGKTMGNSQNLHVKQGYEKFQKRGVKVDLLKELLKIRGSCDQVKKQLAQIQNIHCKPRFATVLEYFRRLEEMLQLFDIYSEPPKEAGYELPAQKGPEFGETSRSSSRPRLPSLPKSAAQKKTLEFDFGLILQQFLAHYSGLIFSVSVVKAHANKNKKSLCSREVTLAYGGRFDNNVANFQFGFNKYLPAAVSLTINCSEFANQALVIEQARDQRLQQTLNRECSSIDFCIGSSNGDPLITQKYQCQQILQLDGYRVHVDYSGHMETHLTELFLNDNNVRFVIQMQQDSLVLKDRFGFFASGQSSSLQVQTESFSSQSQYTFSDVKNLLIEIDKVGASSFKKVPSFRMAAANSVTNQIRSTALSPVMSSKPTP